MLTHLETDGFLCQHCSEHIPFYKNANSMYCGPQYFREATKRRRSPKNNAYPVFSGAPAKHPHPLIKTQAEEAGRPCAPKTLSSDSFYTRLLYGADARPLNNAKQHPPVIRPLVTGKFSGLGATTV